MPHECTFTAPAATHDDENIAAIDLKIEVPLYHKAAESHSEIFYSYVGLWFRHVLSHTLGVDIIPYTD
jgi:hypothetical protein